MKKLFNTVYIFISLISVAFLLFAYTVKNTEADLRCDENGDFTFLVVSDPQCDTEEEWIEAECELETLVKRANPDFVLINGDMNSNNIIPPDMWKLFISPLTKRKIYWSTTNGNHDPFKYEHYKMYKNFDGCLNATVSALDKNYDFTRPMNYVIPIQNNKGDRTVFAIYGMDSGQSGSYGYEGVTKKQTKWYADTSNKLKQSNGGIKVTSVICMHIPLVQTLDMFYSLSSHDVSNGENAGDIYKIYGVANEPNFEYKTYICENDTTVSKLKIHATAFENDAKMFDEILNQGDVKAVIFGHDHRTNFIGSYKGVLLGFAGKISTGCYSDNFCRGGRVIKFNQSQPEKFTAEWLGTLKTSKDQPPIYCDGTLVLQ